MNEFEIIKMMKKRPKSENILYIWCNCLMLAKMHWNKNIKIFNTEKDNDNKVQEDCIEDKDDIAKKMITLKRWLY